MVVIVLGSPIITKLNPRRESTKISGVTQMDNLRRESTIISGVTQMDNLLRESTIIAGGTQMDNPLRENTRVLGGTSLNEVILPHVQKHPTVVPHLGTHQITTMIITTKVRTTPFPQNKLSSLIKIKLSIGILMMMRHQSNRIHLKTS